MAPWKNILLKAIGVGIGVGIALAACVALLFWYNHRPVPEKPWDKNAITATFDYVDTQGENHHLRFFYVLENHTDRDYKIVTADLLVSAVVGEEGSLAGGNNGAVKFEDENIFLPSKQPVVTGLELPNYPYPGSDVLVSDTPDGRKKYREAVKKYVNEQLPKLEGFAAFYEAERFRINFPNGWRGSEKGSMR